MFLIETAERKVEHIVNLIIDTIVHSRDRL